jgi:hypothetical protein
VNKFFASGCSKKGVIEQKMLRYPIVCDKLQKADLQLFINKSNLSKDSILVPCSSTDFLPLIIKAFLLVVEGKSNIIF